MLALSKYTGGVLELKMLIAIKSESLTNLLSSSLSQYDVHICHTGNDTLKQLELLRPDFLILELMLPGMDGITVLRKSRYKPQVILALTNLATQSVLADASDVGIQTVLLIPCTIRYILEHLESLIEKASSAEV